MRYDTTTVGGAFRDGGLPMPPSVIGRPNSSKNPSLTAYARVLAGVPSLRMSVTSLAWRPAARTIDRLGSFSRMISTGDRLPVVTRPSVRAVRTEYRSRAFGYGSGWRRTALTVLKMAVVAPIPIVSVEIAASANAGV